MRPIVTNLDGTHSVSCTATDGQTNTRVGPGSTEMPLAFKVDETPATITCPSPAPTFVLHHRGPDTLTQLLRLRDATADILQFSLMTAKTLRGSYTITVTITKAAAVLNTKSVTITIQRP
jgi:hypothetical protein